MKTETKFAPAELASVDEDGTFSGYASLFGKADLGRDIVLPGAFRASLKKRGAAGIKMLFQHDPAEPIGVWSEIREDQQGLFVKGKLRPGSRGRARCSASCAPAPSMDCRSATGRCADEPTARPAYGAWSKSISGRSRS